MELLNKPNKEKWSEILKRPMVDQDDLNQMVQQIFDEVQKNGDEALKRYTHFFDRVDLKDFRITTQELEEAKNEVSEELKSAIELAVGNIRKFHESQKVNSEVVETIKGVSCWREERAIESVGLYIPGGSAPLFSTLIMLAVPALIAGCENIIVCTPPNNQGVIAPEILYTANLLGLNQVYKVGGIQAVGGLTFGTETIPKVDKIFGPGNQYVTAAKQYALNFGVAIDMPAGPSEVLIIADENADPTFVAADLLSQAEHGKDSQVLLLTNDENIAEKVIQEVEIQKASLPRIDAVDESLKNSKAIVLTSLEDCFEMSNFYAPEHLIIACDDFKNWIGSIKSAGSVFLGPYSCESGGDYATGTNHTLPTNGFARNYSGVNLQSFMKQITFQELSAEGIQKIGPAVEIMAEAEQLLAHKNAVTYRLQKLKS